MALFQNKPQAADSVQYFSIGLNKTILLVGLGNPEPEYDLTRHNAGFQALNYFVDKTTEMSDWMAKKDLKCLLSSGQLGQTRVIAIKPTTYMNHSGEAVQAVTQFYKINPDNIVVIYDDLDINFGDLRLRQGGSSGGHNGIKSVTQHIGENYGRLRIGIGPKSPEQIDSADFVLQKFNADQQSQLTNMSREVASVISEFVYGGQLPADTRSFIV